MKIVVIGGTGLIGSKTVAILRQGGHDLVAASPPGRETDRWERLHLVKPPGLPRCSQSPEHVRAYSQVCSASAEAR